MKKSIQIYFHIAFWLLASTSTLLGMLMYEYVKDDNTYFYTVYVQTNSMLFIPLYFYLGYLSIMKIPKIKKIKWYFIVLIPLLYIGIFFYSKKIFVYSIEPSFRVILWFALGSLFRFFIDWFNKKSSIQTLQKENIESQLALLRMQINPHFLFNTLHNIDALIYKYPERASLSIVKLSDIMRYMLNDSKTEFISIEKELAYLENYITLEKLRLKNENFLDYTISGDFKNKQIAVMILIPFIENAFKHSVDSEINQGIIIHFSFIQNKLIFTCANKFDVLTIDKDKAHGIGLDTVKKRLSILYANKHNLTITRENSIFKVELEILLDES